MRYFRVAQREEGLYRLGTEDVDKRAYIPYVRIVKDYIDLHRTALLEMWETEKYGKLPPLK